MGASGWFGFFISVAISKCSSSESWHFVLRSSQHRSSLLSRGEASERVDFGNGDSKQSESHHSAERNMNDQPNEQVAHNQLEGHPSSEEPEVSLLAKRLEAKFETNAVHDVHTVRHRVLHNHSCMSSCQ